MAEGKVFTLEECKKHTSDKDCWLIVHGKVYDVTDFLEEHPGGYDIILTSAGRAEALAPAWAGGRACAAMRAGASTRGARRKHLMIPCPCCYTGKDSTQDFEEIGHSNSAREILEKYIIGKYAVRGAHHAGQLRVFDTNYVLECPGWPWDC